MSVAELIVALQGMPQDAQVFIYGEQFSFGYDEMSASHIEYVEGDEEQSQGVWLG